MAKTPAKTEKKATPGTHGHWDVVAAEKDYLGDNTMSYRKIAEKYGVSKTSVEKVARKNKWTERRQKLVDSGIEKFEENQTEIIAEANERHLKMYKNMQSAGNATLVYILKDARNAKGEMTRMPDVKDMSGAAHVLKQGIEGERTVLGLPTMIQGFGDSGGEKDIATWTDLMLAVAEADKHDKPEA